jgi:Meckel syndrome type 1 protein
MTTSHRDLAQPHPWQRSLERSLHRRAIAPQVRRSVARRKRASVALSTLMVAGPTGSLLAAAGFGLGGRGVDVAQASPASRAIDSGATPAAMAFELGSRGDAVAEIQRQLGVPVDGIFGPVTQVAVQRFQAGNGLDVDGIVGPATWTALFGLGQAAAAAGARDGSVAVILREGGGSDHPGGSDPDSSAAGGDPTGSGSDGDRADTPADSDSLAVGGDIPASDPPDSTQPAKDVPATKPVTAPAPGNGACGPLRLSAPVKGMVTSGFGPRWGRNHDGLDIAAATGTPIRAAECGIVSFAGVQSGYGNMVCVKHSSRFETCYAHMTKYAVAQGQRVHQGQVIGYVGCTGNCTGPHLHFETRVDGSARDPRPYLGGGSVPGAPTVKAAAKPKLTASIRKDVARARVTAQATIGAQPRATVAAPVATTGAPAPTAVAPAPTTTTPPAAPVPAAAQPTYSAPAPAPAPATPAPAPVAEAPAPVAPPETPPTITAPAAAPVAAAPAAVSPPTTTTPTATPVTEQPAPVATPDSGTDAPDRDASRADRSRPGA